MTTKTSPTAETEMTDVESLDRDELKQLIKDEALEIKVKKSMSDDDIRSLIAEAIAAEVEEDEDDDDEEDEVEEKVEGVALSSVYVKYAKARDIDTTRAAKLVRARLRSNFDKVCELDPNIAKVKTASNDGNHWPPVISKKLAKFLTA